MTRTNLYTGAARWALLIGLAALPLTGCKPAASPNDASSAPSSALPLVDSGAPVAPAPPVAELPPAPRVPIGHVRNPGDYYAFADQAYAMNQGFGDAPPDYQYDYDGANPWVWRSDNGAIRVAEALAGGGDRYYYYEPGADYPYLVRDPQYSYGYDNGQLVVIYDVHGRPLPESEFEQRQDYASRFYARGRSLYSGAQQQQHQAVAQSNWVQRRNAYYEDQQRWTADQHGDPAWQSYHQSHQQQDEDQWAAERARRENEAAQFAITINDTQAAQRDRDAAQRAQQHAQSAPPPPQGGFFHLGGPRPGGDQGPPPVAPGGGEPPHQGPGAGPAAGPVAGPADGAPNGGDHRQDHAGPGGAGPQNGQFPHHDGMMPPGGAPAGGDHRQDHAGPGAVGAQTGQPPRHEGVAPPAVAPQQGRAPGENHQPPPHYGGGLAGAIAAHEAAKHPPVTEVHPATPGPRPIVTKPVGTPVVTRPGEPPKGGEHPGGPGHGPDDRHDHPNGQ